MHLTLIKSRAVLAPTHSALGTRPFLPFNQWTLGRYKLAAGIAAMACVSVIFSAEISKAHHGPDGPSSFPLLSFPIGLIALFQVLFPLIQSIYPPFWVALFKISQMISHFRYFLCFSRLNLPSNWNPFSIVSSLFKFDTTGKTIKRPYGAITIFSTSLTFCSIFISIFQSLVVLITIIATCNFVL